jgi:2-desacetyl-2-hydroxyethyl bacteriochlorophyllide A dehydrogenase
MRQAIMTAPGTIEFRETAAPQAGRGEVLLRIRRIGICGSDVHVYHGRHPYTKYPVVQGHEFSAVVEQTGPGVTGLRPGMLVTALPQVVCGQCAPCRRGDYHICDVLKVQGFQAPGCAQDLFVTSADKIVPLPEGFTPEQGALVEPLSVAVHAVGRAGDVRGKNVVVLGAGPIGNLVAQVAQAAGAKPLIADLSDYRLEVAGQCGLARRFNAGKETLGDAAKRVFGAEGFQVAYECAGSEQTIGCAINTIGKGGTIIVVAVFGEKPRVDVGLIQDRELTVRGTLMYRLEDYQRAVALIAGGQVATGPLDSRHFPFAQFPEAYAFIQRQGDKCVKVFVDLD